MSYFGPIGLANRRVMIQRLTTVLDAAGQPIETWADDQPVWSRLITQRGGERFTAQQVMGSAVKTFRIRFQEGLTVHTTRLVYEGKDYDISDIRELGMREALELDATARSEG